MSKHSNRAVEELVKWVEQEYWAYDRDTSGRIWDMKTRVLGEVIKHKGNNDFVMPHRKIIRISVRVSRKRALYCMLTRPPDVLELYICCTCT